MLAATVIGIALLAAGAPPPQAPNDEAVRKKVQGYLDLSADSYKAGDYQGALVGLQRAAELRPVPLVRFNIGRCLEQLGRHGQAIAAFEQYLEMDDATTGAAERQRRAREIIARLEPRVFSALRVECALPGSQVAVAGVSDSPVACPAHLGRLRPGPYRVRVSAGGRVYFSGEVLVKLGEPAVLFAAAAATAHDAGAR